MHWRGERPQRVFSLILNKTWIRNGYLGRRGSPESIFINFDQELKKECTGGKGVVVVVVMVSRGAGPKPWACAPPLPPKPAPAGLAGLAGLAGWAGLAGRLESNLVKSMKI
jgi:hypothetical protein